jgi:hypothetical protein
MTLAKMSAPVCERCGCFLERAHIITAGVERAIRDEGIVVVISSPPLRWTLCVRCADRAETTIRDAIADVAP